MRKSRLILGCLVAAVALAGLTGCLLPDYGLQFQFTPNWETIDGVGSANDLRLELTVTNSGSEAVKNIQVYTDIEMNAYGVDYNWANIGDLGAGQSRTVTVATYLNDTILDDPRVIEVLWDVDK